MKRPRRDKIELRTPEEEIRLFKNMFFQASSNHSPLKDKIGELDCREVLLCTEAKRKCKAGMTLRV